MSTVFKVDISKGHTVKDFGQRLTSIMAPIFSDLGERCPWAGIDG